MRSPSSAIWGITAASLAYATLRYNVFKGVPWSDWPVFVLNKAIALSSLLLLVAWIVQARRGARAPQAALLAAASRMALAHIGLSFVLLTPVYFPTFFSDGRLTWQAGAAILLGLAAATGMSVASRPGSAHRSKLTAPGVAALAGGSHAALFGYSGWFTPSAWPGCLLPITLVSFAAGVIGIVAALGGRSSPPESR